MRHNPTFFGFCFLPAGDGFFREADNEALPLKTMPDHGSLHDCGLLLAAADTHQRKKKEIKKIRSALVERDRFELGNQLPDPCPSMDGHVGIVGNFIDF